MTSLPLPEHPRPALRPAAFARLLDDARLAPLWALLRVYVGWEWLGAGWGKLTNPGGAWVGEHAGAAVTGFLKGALAKTGGEHPDVQAWYAWFVQHVALPNATAFSYLVAFGEVAIGLALILGLFTGVAAFFGGFLNANFLLAGAVSTNPVLFILATWLVLEHRAAGRLGADGLIVPRALRLLADRRERGKPAGPAVR